MGRVGDELWLEVTLTHDQRQLRLRSISPSFFINVLVVLAHNFVVLGFVLVI